MSELKKREDDPEWKAHARSVGVDPDEPDDFNKAIVTEAP